MTTEQPPVHHPALLRALRKPTTPPPTNGSNGTHPPKMVGEATPYGEKALHLEVDAVLAAPEGTRNDRLNTAAFNLAQLVAGGELNPTDVYQALALAGQTAGLDSREIPATIRSGAAAGLQHPRNAPPTTTGTPAPDVAVVAAQPAFWATRPRLQLLHDWAKARQTSPWAVLGVTLARVVAATDHRIVIPPLIGGPASLNMFVGLVGPPGSGKGVSEAVALEALPIPDGFTNPKIGSGEGIAHSYMKREKGTLIQHETACLFSVPEIDTMQALGTRQSSTLIPELRSAWSGEALGFAYADPTKRLPVPRHQYRLCLVAGIQAARSGALLNDSDAGTPQRFIWMPALDPHAPDTHNIPTAPQPIPWRRPPWTPTDPISGTHHLTICDTATHTIRTNRVARLRGEGDALDGHALLCRLKTAVALALLEERLEVTDQDWELAGVIQTMSDRTRAACEQTLQDAHRVTNEARARSEADRTAIAAEHLEEAAIRRVTRNLIRLLSTTDEDTASAGYLRRKIKFKERHLTEEALERAIAAGQIEPIDTTKGTRYRVVKDTQK